MSKPVPKHDRELRLAMVWNQTVIAEHTLETPRSVILGYGSDALFPLPETHDEAGDVTLLVPNATGYVLHLPAQARGAVWLNGRRYEVTQLRANGAELALGPTDFGVVSIGAASFFFQYTRGAREPQRAFSSLDGEAVQSFGLSLFVHVCVLLLMLLAQREFPEDTGLELSQDLIARFLVTPPPDELEPTKKAPSQEDDGAKALRDEGAKPKSKDDEGKVGERDKKEKAPQIEGPRDAAIVSKVRGMGLLGALAGGDTLRGVFDAPQVSDILSGLDSARTDLGQGSGGRGLRGVGKGGGGDGAGTLFGAGGLGTGLGAGAGAGGGKGKGAGGKGAGAGQARAEAKVQLTPGTPQVSGYLSAEQINRVVRANQAALRYCYESEVQRQRALKGKIVVQWRVDRGGLVPSARVATTTLNDSRVEGCVVRQIRKWHFPKPDGGEVSVMYPFVFGVGG